MLFDILSATCEPFIKFDHKNEDNTCMHPMAYSQHLLKEACTDFFWYFRNFLVFSHNPCEIFQLQYVFCFGDIGENFWYVLSKGENATIMVNIIKHRGGAIGGGAKAPLKIFKKREKWKKIWGIFMHQNLSKLAFLSSLTRKYVLWKGFYHNFSTKKALSPGPPRFLRP